MHVLNRRYWKWEKSGSPQSQRQFDIFGERCGQVAATGGPHARQVVGTVVGVVGYDERSRPETALHQIQNIGIEGLGAVKQEQVGSEEPTSELQSLMRISYAVFSLTKKTKRT